MRVSAPFGYFGGKMYMLPYLLPLVPPHHTYCELFGGAAWLLLAKEPSNVEIYNDLDGDLVHFYRVLRDPALCRQLQERLELTPYARAEYQECRCSYAMEQDAVERARQWFVVMRQSFAGRFGSSGWSYTLHSNLDHCVTTNKWLHSIAGLPAVHQRLRHVQIECKDWRRVLDFVDGPDVLLYVDPPYVQSTRGASRHGYKHELRDDEHAELVQRLLAAQSMVILSGYDHPLYAPLAHWHRVDVVTSAHSAGRTRATHLLGDGAARSRQPRVETVWRNFNPQAKRGQHTLFSGVECAS